MGRGKGADSRIGTELAGYRIEGILGRGGMSVVYLAEHLKLRRKVALKILDSELSEDERFRERFVRESQLAAALEDPNVIPIYEAGEADGTLFIAMRRVGGTDLKELLLREGALPPARAASIISQVASALDAAHAQGLVHRDVKPGNILIVPPSDPARSEHVYLSDFGLTKRTSSESGITGTGQFVGTLDYAAPEQFEGKPLDPRTDVYSLGCVLFETLTGQPPFRKEQDAALMYAHLNEPPPRVTALRPELPPAIDGVVANAMAKRREERYQSAGALGDAARRALEGQAPPPPAAPEPAGPGRPRPRRRSLLIGGGTLVLVAAAVVAIVLSRGGGRSGIAPTGHSPSPPVTTPSGGGPPSLSVFSLNPANGKIVKTVPRALNSAILGIGSPMAVGERGVWIVVHLSVVHIDERSGTFHRLPLQLPIGPGCCSIAAGFPSTWIAGGPLVLRIDPATDELLKPVSLPAGSGIGVALGQGSAWVIGDDHVLTRIDVRTGSIQSRTVVHGTLDSVIDGAGAVWIIDTLAGAVFRVDPKDPKRVVRIPITGGINGAAAGSGGLWILDRSSGTVSLIDPATNRQGAPIRVGTGPVGIAAGLGGVWVTDQTDEAVYRIDPVTQAVRPIPIGAPVAGIAVDQPLGQLWVEVLPKA